MRKFPAVLTLCLLPALPLFAGEGHDDHDDHAHEAHGEDHKDDIHLSEKDGVRLLHPWGVMSRDGLEVYVTIENGSGSTITITGGDSAHGDLMLLATDPGTDTVVPVSEMPVSAGAEMEFAPGELFLRLDTPPDLHVGDVIEAHLELAPMGEIQMDIEIFGPGTTDHPHAGHNH